METNNFETPVMDERIVKLNELKSVKMSSLSKSKRPAAKANKTAAQYILENWDNTEMLQKYVNDPTSPVESYEAYCIADSHVKQLMIEAAKIENDRKEAEENRWKEEWHNGIWYHLAMLYMALRSVPSDSFAYMGLKEDATPEEIMKRYRELSLKCHPDKGGNQEEFNKIAQEAIEEYERGGDIFFSSTGKSIGREIESEKIIEENILFANIINASICICGAILIMIAAYNQWSQYGEYTVFRFLCSLFLHGGFMFMIYLGINWVIDRLFNKDNEKI